MLANTSIAVILSIVFLIFNNANILFTEQELIRRLYTLAKALLTTKQVQIIGQKEFGAAVLDLDKETFVDHVVFPGLKLKMSIYSSLESPNSIDSN